MVLSDRELKDFSSGFIFFQPIRQGNSQNLFATWPMHRIWLGATYVSKKNGNGYS
jgi:hypothetical protein